ncbi:MAG: type IV secretion system DNA-binding domain-containing protein [bacterium]|nr:type IV secretion system DNA-binding domain-containing protein [bacterium]
MKLGLFIILAVVVLGIFIAIVVFLRKKSWRDLLKKSLELRLLLVRLPQSIEKDQVKLVDEISVFGQLSSILAGLKQPFALEVAMPIDQEEINFYVAVPQDSTEFVSRQIQGLWGEAQVDRVDDYTVFNPLGATAVAYIKQKMHYATPIRTFAESNTDTFLPILSNFTKLHGTGEGVAIQLIVKPAPISIKNNIDKLINKLKQGISLNNALRGKSLESKKDKNQLEPPRVIDDEAVKLLSSKIAKQLFSVNARLIASAATAERAEDLLNSLAGSYNQFSAPSHNLFSIISPKKPRNLSYQFSFRQYDARQGMILGADELASIFHFPTSTTNIPKIKWLKSKEATPPPNLPGEGVVIGQSVFRGDAKRIHLTDEDRRRHLYVVGQTGTGKSSLLINMAADDIKRGKGLAIVDPHGDLIDSILGLVPPERQKDVIIFDPGDITRPLGLNMLEYDASRPEEKTFIVNEMQSIFNKLFSAETMGPMFEQYMRNALLLLMEDMINSPSTLTEVPRVFTDVVFRKDKLSRALNPTLIDFWEKEAIKAGGEASLANITPYVTSKFNNFLANDYVRPIIGQVRSAFNFRKVMDDGKILLVNLSKGRIGDINAGLLGMIIVGKVLMAALSRVNLPQEQRRDFNLYIDEFQNFTTDSISTILSEARKYRLNLVIAHQFIGQLEENIRDAVFGNVGSMVVFRVGVDDAEFLVKQFEPVFSKNDLINIDNFNAYVKLLINGQTTKPFNIKTINPNSGDEKLKAVLKEYSRNAYGRDRGEVEAEILKRLRS